MNRRNLFSLAPLVLLVQPVKEVVWPTHIIEYYLRREEQRRANLRREPLLYLADGTLDQETDLEGPRHRKMDAYYTTQIKGLSNLYLAPATAPTAVLLPYLKETATLIQAEERYQENRNWQGLDPKSDLYPHLERQRMLQTFLAQRVKSRSPVE